MTNKTLKSRIADAQQELTIARQLSVGCFNRANGDAITEDAERHNAVRRAIEAEHKLSILYHGDIDTYIKNIAEQGDELTSTAVDEGRYGEHYREAVTDNGTPFHFFDDKCYGVYSVPNFGTGYSEELAMQTCPMLNEEYTQAFDSYFDYPTEQIDNLIKEQFDLIKSIKH